MSDLTVLVEAYAAILGATEGGLRDGTVETPLRAANGWLELVSGYAIDVPALFKTFEADGYDEMIAVTDIPYASLCVPSMQIVNRVGGSLAARAIRKGDDLWTLHDGRLAETTVCKIAKRATHDVVYVKTSRGRLALTGDHPVRGVRGWIEAADLEPGDLIQFFPPHSLCRRQGVVSPGYDLGYLIGAVAAEGSIQRNRISVVVSDRAFASRVASSWQTAMRISARVEEVNVPSGFRRESIPMFRVRVVSSWAVATLRRWLDLRGSDKTRGFGFPRVVTASESMMQGFLDGYCDGDGHVVLGRHGRRASRAITTANARFAGELAEYLAVPVGRAGEGTLRVPVSDRWQKPGWYGKHGYRQLEEFSMPLDSELAAVISVERPKRGTKPYTVYSFKCEPHPTFLVGGHLSHNCEHHLLSFRGLAHVVYLPGDRVIGLSKIPRLVEAYARRLQQQERLTAQVADALEEHLAPRGVLVMVEGEHSCATLRGVRTHGATMRTSITRGVMREKPESRAEALALIGRGT